MVARLEYETRVDLAVRQSGLKREVEQLTKAMNEHSETIRLLQARVQYINSERDSIQHVLDNADDPTPLACCPGDAAAVSAVQTTVAYRTTENKVVEFPNRRIS